MSRPRLVIRDQRREIHAPKCADFVQRVVAALSAEPETIEELEQALERFARPYSDGFFGRFKPRAPSDTNASPLVVVDLAARLVVWNADDEPPKRDGYIPLHDGPSDHETHARYHLPDDWEFVSGEPDWRKRADERRQKRLAMPPLDARAVLYGKPLLGFIAVEGLKAFGPAQPQPAVLAAGAKSTSSGGDADNAELQNEAEGDAPPWENCDDPRYDVIRQIHARWLATPRDDLRGAGPRDVLLVNREFIEWDMQDRCQQWSEQGRPVRPLDSSSHAYRFGGIGTHEVVLYYDLVRRLLWSFVGGAPPEAPPQGAASPSPEAIAAEVGRLRQVRDVWLDGPEREFHGRTPRSVIENERIRMPETMSGKEAVIDPDCPLCAMAAEFSGPMFWHLDGCNMDRDFEFSFHRTRAEWEEEERRYEEYSRRFNEEQEELKRLGVKRPGESADPDSPWVSSYVAPDTAETPVFVRLFGIGTLLAELIVDLKRPTEDRALIDRLQRDFGNLRDVAQSNDLATLESLLEPVLDRFCKTLDDVAKSREDLAEKCSDLRERLQMFLAPPEPSEPLPDFDDEIPF
ncbi:MAG: hypothetical protein HYS13_08975 [Planctomycetia bacterium]|nr:hypothetical protein [Planctomycetia bacterium]